MSRRDDQPGEDRGPARRALITPLLDRFLVSPDASPKDVVLVSLISIVIGWALLFVFAAMVGISLGSMLWVAVGVTVVLLLVKWGYYRRRRATTP